MHRRHFLRTVGVAAGAGPLLQAPAGPEYDYVIAGAGSSGCAVAARLSEDPSVRVLLVEAGQSAAADETVQTPGRWVSLMGSEWDWQYMTEGVDAMGGRRLACPRGRALGGSSAINAMTYIRGHRADFDAWGAVNPGWSFADVLPYFVRSERNSRGASGYHGADGPLAVSDGLDPHAGHAAFLEAARQRGFGAAPDWDFNGPGQANGAGYVQKNILRGRRHSAADAYLTPVRSRPNLTILSRAHAVRIVIEGRRAVALEYVRDGRRATVRAAREIVVSCGVVDSPRLLMLSGIGPAANLRGVGLPVRLDLPGVGANLQDHLKISVRWKGRGVLPPSTVTAGLFTWSSEAARQAARPSEAPDLQYYVGRGVDADDPFVTITASLVRPVSRGDIRLRSADPLAPPAIRTGYLEAAEDLRALAAGVRLAREIAGARAYDALRGEELEPGAGVRTEREMTQFLRRAADTIYHPAGTCRMGSGPRAVVDAALRIHGLEGLRVADASIMPDVVNATTHAACVMIGEKAADLIRGAERGVLDARAAR